MYLRQMATPVPQTHSPITADNHAPIIEIALYFLMVTFILAVIIRFAIRLAIARSISRDDWVSFGSMVYWVCLLSCRHPANFISRLLALANVLQLLQVFGMV